MGKLKKALAGLMAVCMLMSTLTPVMAYSSDVSMAEKTNPVVAGDAVFTDEEPSTPDDIAEPEEPTPTEAPESGTEDDVSEGDDIPPELESTPEPSATPEEAEPAEAPTEDSTEFVPFQLEDPEEGDTQEANLGDTVTFNAKGNRDDVQVVYQWQVMRKGVDYSAQGAIYDYDEDEPTWYNFPLENTTEVEQLENNPDATWPGIETYYAVVEALDAIDADSSSVSLGWRTENYALEGYAISAAQVDDHIEVYADKDNVRYTAKLNDEGKFEFSNEAGEAPSVASNTWLDIEGANESSYTFEVTEEDLNSVFRCKVTVVDEAYLAQCAEILKEHGTELSEEELDADQNLYSIAMYVHSDAYDQMLAEQKGNLVETYALQPSDHPKLSSDAQWIEGLNNTYEYITKDTYERVSKWLAEGKITEQQAKYYWTRLGNGFDQYANANVLDENGFPTGQTREYKGTDLTDGAMEVLSEWYGKTVLFRVHNSNNVVEIKIPAYTSLTVNDDGSYVEAASGTKYKKAITVLNAFVPDTGSMYKTFLETVTQDGWLYDSEDSNIHIKLYTVTCEALNKDPERYLVDAEGNYRMDAVAWGVCTYNEPDLSGKAYWLLKDYIGNGYGFMSGHDTMYAYAGAYYDAYGHDLDESSIDPNDTTTWYYDINSWQPSATDPNGNKNYRRGGHFYMNQLVGSNKGNVYSGTVKPKDAPGLILSTGGSHGRYGKDIQFGSTRLRVVQTGCTTAEAVANAKYRTPTNYPYQYSQNDTFESSDTHTNQQAAFGPIWVEYNGKNINAERWGYFEDPKSWTIDGMTGTNNFYLTGSGNYLMNQIGHLPTNAATKGEARLFINSLMYISQRKQCEICAANQNGRSDTHFVHRVTSANASQILSVLQSGGNYWYPLSDCYLLTDDITLPEGWTPISGFTGHWDNDIYKVTLASNGAPLLEQKNGTGWNLGIDSKKGTEQVFDGNNNRTTGVARIVGDLNDLFETSTNYAGYTVQINGSDNPKYMRAGEVYTCTVNTDSKYVISNMPCVYDGLYGVLKAHVYRPDGSEVTEYGEVRVNVSEDFWNTCDTTPLYLYRPEVKVQPIPNRETYEMEPATFTSKIRFTREIAGSEIHWQWRKDENSDWADMETGPWGTNYTTTNPTYVADDEFGVESTVTLTLNAAKAIWNGYEFRACITVDGHGTTNTWEYYTVNHINYTVNSRDTANAAFDVGGAVTKIATEPAKGMLTVKPWPMKMIQADDQEVYVTQNATFTVVADYWKGLDNGLTLEWQYKAVDGGSEWRNVDRIGKTTTQSSASAEIPVYRGIQTAYGFANISEYRTTTTLTIPKCDLVYSGDLYRVHFRYTNDDGVTYDWYSDAVNQLDYGWDQNVDAYGEATNGPANDNRKGRLVVNPPDVQVELRKAASEWGSRDHQDTMTPDEYGQMVTANGSTGIYNGTVYYTAILYYDPAEGVLDSITPNWQYRTYLNGTYKDWNDSTAKSIDGRMSVSVTNTDLGIPEAGNTYYNAAYPGYHAVKSVMSITNVPLSIYNPDTFTAYYFRCFATGNYTTALGKGDRKAHSRLADLVVDYDISLHHNGVQTYMNTNIVNGKTATTIEDLDNFTKGQQYSTWKYPNLKIIEPRRINTVVVKLLPAPGKSSYDSRDRVHVNWTWVQNEGITITGDDYHLYMVANTQNSITTETWEKVLRWVQFTTYDQFSVGPDGVTGGVKVMWYADENRVPDRTSLFFNGSTYQWVWRGAGYENKISWDDARAAAKNMYNQDTQSYGYLAHITSAEEWAFVLSLPHEKNSDYFYWLGAWHNGADSYWRWIDGPANEGDAWFYSRFETRTLLWGFNGWLDGEPNCRHINAKNDFNYGIDEYEHWLGVPGGSGKWNDWANHDPHGVGYLVEWNGTQTELGMTRTNHSVMDTDIIGTNMAANNKGLSLTMTVTGGVKTYDGTELMPTISVTSTTVDNPAQYVQATYTCSTDAADYTEVTLPASATSGDGIINSGNYKVMLTLTDAGVAAGIQVTEDSKTVAPLAITPRPIVLAGSDTKVYDGTDDASLSNIHIKDPDGNTGVLAGDTVTISTTTGVGKSASIHTGNWDITLNEAPELVENPHDNYYIASKEFIETITPRPLAVHSRYLEDPENPRNIKNYDATKDGFIRDILIDNIVPGDTVKLANETYKGIYATDQAGETLDENGNPQLDRNKKLQEVEITRSPDDPISLKNDPHNDYYIASESYSGAIRRAVLESRIKSAQFMYGAGTIEQPWHINNFDKNTPFKVDGWLSITGLVGNDKLDLSGTSFIFGSKAPDDSSINFGQKTSVGKYPITSGGLTEANYPVLKNYIVTEYDGMLEITPRPVTITANDIDWGAKDKGTPVPHFTMEMMNDDGETYTTVGSDADKSYTDMALIGTDTVKQYIRSVSGDANPTVASDEGVLAKTSSDIPASVTELGEGSSKHTVLYNRSNVWYNTFWYPSAPVKYLHIGETDATLKPCDWCIDHYGEMLAPDHWDLDGYELRVNQNADEGNILKVATVTNPLGQEVQNYELSYVSGQIRVHPGPNVQIDATVPMYVCMYGYAGDGEVVEPTNYGITNYTLNSDIVINDILVGDLDGSTVGWNIVDKKRAELKQGEMSMLMNGTQLKMGHNTDIDLDKWRVGEDTSDDHAGVYLNLPMTCYMAGGNVNAHGESFVTKVTYFVGIPGK